MQNASASLIFANPEKPKVLFLVTLNLFTAFFAQMLFHLLMLANIYQLVGPDGNGLPDSEIKRLIKLGTSNDDGIVELLVIIATIFVFAYCYLPTRLLVPHRRTWLRLAILQSLAQCFIFSPLGAWALKECILRWA